MTDNLIKILKYRPFAGMLFLLVVLVSSCKDDDNPSPVLNQNIYVNDWILENMQYWYLWSDQLPASPDKSQVPDEFFQSLLDAEDRFSWIQDDYADLLNSLQGINREAGYEYVLYKDDGTDNVIAQILYVKSNSPAETAGLKRGDKITRINGQQMNTGNYQTVLKNTSSNSYTITYEPLLIEEQKFDSEKTATLSTIIYSEDPNYLNKVIQINDKKIGYYVYNFFSSGAGQDSLKYDVKMDEIFADFKAQSITDLVLDLRFNSGGSETSATNLGSLIAPDASNDKIFFRREYNDRVENDVRSNMGESFLLSRLLNKGENIGNQLSGHVYILTGSRTASASELIINGLKPYMDVFLIGDVTYGKNVGSISIYDEDDPKNTWGMQPIIVKVYNSLDQSDYSEGFVPNIENKDNNLLIYPLGDTREELLNKALEQITGAPIGGRKRQAVELREMIGHSLDQKRRSFILNVEALRGM